MRRYRLPDPEADDDGEGTGGDVEDGSDEERSAGGRFTGRSASEIVRSLWTPKARTPASPRPAASREVVTGLSRQERTLGFAGAALAVAVSVQLFIGIHDLTGTTTKDIDLRHQASTVLIAGLALAALLVVGAATRRRALLGFGALLVGFAVITFGDIFGLLFLVFGGWLIMRVMRKQRQDRDAGTGGASRGSTSSTRRRSGATSPVPPKTPPASKRYTPPKRAGAASSRRR